MLYSRREKLLYLWLILGSSRIINKVLLDEIDYLFDLNIKDLCTHVGSVDKLNQLTERAKTIKLEEIISRIDEEKIKFYCLIDEGFPSDLLEVNCSLLFYKGEISKINQESVSVVGTRRYSLISKRFIEQNIPLISEYLVIVSGMALGIDTIAHKNAKDFNTMAVLGSGLDKHSIYPRDNFRLAQDVIDNGGLIVSEELPGFTPKSYSFPKRNRLIAALSRFLIVVQAPDPSGSLITADYAKKLSRAIFAIPADFDNHGFFGNFKLIKQGAGLILNADDFLEQVYPSRSDQEKSLDTHHGSIDNLDNRVQKLIYENISRMSLDEIVQQFSLNTLEAQIEYTSLEIKGLL